MDGSADGGVLVGRWGSTVMRWVEGSDPEFLAANGEHGRSLSGPSLFREPSYASGVSADGTIIVGGGGLPEHGGLTEAFIWREGVPTVGLGTLYTAAGSTSSATAVSPDGRIVVGTSSGPGGSPTNGFRWTAETGMESLGNFYPEAVSDTGVIVGQSPYAAVLGSSLGDGALGPLLQQNCGVDLTGWYLVAARDITPDGKTLVGTALNPIGRYQGFVVYLR
jgi:probable HAF family extracellular repeat protein